MTDWAFALLFRPDIVKVGLDSETASHLREIATADAVAWQADLGGCEPCPADKPQPVPVAAGNGAA